MTDFVDYPLLAAQLDALVADSPCALSSLCNAAALLWHSLPQLNWAGFYLLKGESLVLGPFQGKVACVRIPLGKGVCGTAAQTLQPQLVLDVHQFPGHIACDSASSSELVLPILHQGRLYGVLDLDSPDLGRFTQADLDGLQPVADRIGEVLAQEEGLM